MPSEATPVPGLPPACAAVVDRLPAAAEGNDALDDEARAHVEQCLRCQAEAVRYRRLRRTLRSLQGENVEPTPGALDGLIAAVAAGGGRQEGRAERRGRRVAYISGLAAATAAGAAGALVLATRSRRMRLAG